jgi:hypothetical protein
LRGLEQDRRWRSSKECLDATADASRAFCKGYFELKAEAARASEAGHLEGQLAGLKRESRQLEEQGAGREADNQAAVLGRVTGLPAAQIERSLTLFLAILVEIGAALGLYFATGHMRGRRGAVIEAEVLKPRLLAEPQRATVKQIGAAAPRRVPRMNGRGIQ